MGNNQTFLNFLQKRVSEIRETSVSGNISYLQVGACDGEFDDFAYHLVTKSDFGILIEANKIAFDRLVENKKEYINCQLYNFAVLPVALTYQGLEFKNQTTGLSRDLPLGSSFLSVPPGSEVDNSVPVVDTLELVTKYNTNAVDCLFVDIEGLDVNFVVEYTNYYQPTLVVFEGWNYVPTLPAVLSREIGIKDLQEKGYSIYQIEDEICAYKLK